jgi:hypothetical protein
MSETYESRKIVLENWVSQSQMTSPYIIFLVYDGSLAGAVVNGSTGAVAADNAYADGAIVGAAHAVSGEPVYTIPALSKDYKYRILLRDMAEATPANTDIVYDAGFYDPATGSTFGGFIVDNDRVKNGSIFGF